MTPRYVTALERSGTRARDVTAGERSARRRLRGREGAGTCGGAGGAAGGAERSGAELRVGGAMRGGAENSR